jgi:hypothetical protein
LSIQSKHLAPVEEARRLAEGAGLISVHLAKVPRTTRGSRRVMGLKLAWRSLSFPPVNFEDGYLLEVLDWLGHQVVHLLDALVQVGATGRRVVMHWHAIPQVLVIAAPVHV